MGVNSDYYLKTGISVDSNVEGNTQVHNILGRNQRIVFAVIVNERYWRFI